MKIKTLILMILLPLALTAQNQKVYMKVVSALQRGDVETATAMLESQVKKEKKVSEWYKALDDTYKYTDNVEARINLLQNAVQVKGIKELDLLKFRLAIALFDAGRYDESLAILNKLPQKSQVKSMKVSCANAKQLRANPLDTRIEPMGDSINTPYDNIWPLIDNEKSHFYTTVVVGKSTVLEKSPDVQEDIFCSTASDGRWLPTQALKGELRSMDNEGACSISADGNYIFFAACNRGGGSGCDIYYSRLKDGKWGKPVRAQAPLNKFEWQSTPSISSDGSMLYFSAIDSKSATGKDIYSCEVSYAKDGTPHFSNVKRLGPEINSDHNEISPFISPYGNILYFASNGRCGMGGLDIYYSKLKDDGTWSEAVNMGFPINTHRDEFGFVVDVEGKNGYMSCNGLEGGEFWQNKRIVRIPLGAEHRTPAPFEDKGNDFILENIYFALDSSNLEEESFAYLDAFAEYLKVHPKYSITITGHTDNTGTEEHNVALSEARALSVAAYLKKKGVDDSRITTSGLGSSTPLQSNETEEGRARNRRIEVSISSSH